MPASDSDGVMARLSRSKNGVASLGYVPAIHDCICLLSDVAARHKAGHGEHSSERLSLCLLS